MDIGDSGACIHIEDLLQHDRQATRGFSRARKYHLRRRFEGASLRPSRPSAPSLLRPARPSAPSEKLCAQFGSNKQDVRKGGIHERTVAKVWTNTQYLLTVRSSVEVPVVEAFPWAKGGRRDGGVWNRGRGSSWVAIVSPASSTFGWVGAGVGAGVGFSCPQCVQNLAVTLAWVWPVSAQKGVHSEVLLAAVVVWVLILIALNGEVMNSGFAAKRLRCIRHPLFDCTTLPMPPAVLRGLLRRAPPMRVLTK